MERSQSDKLFNLITSNGNREMTEERFFQAINEIRSLNGTKELIEKAAEDYERFTSVKSDKVSFIAGANFVLQQVEVKSEWIPVKDTLPDKEDEYLVCGLGMVSTLCFQEGKWYSYVFNQFVAQDKISHWMPLPEPPKT